MEAAEEFPLRYTLFEVLNLCFVSRTHSQTQLDQQSIVEINVEWFDKCPLF